LTDIKIPQVKNYYQILGLKNHASMEEVKKAYKKHVVKLHPDKHKGDSFFEEKFKEIKDAYEYLVKNGGQNFNSKNTDNSYLNAQKAELNKQLIKFNLDKINLEKDKRLFKFAKEELIKREESLKQKESEIIQVNTESKEWLEREKTILFNEGNVEINLNRLIVNNVVVELKNISKVEIEEIKKGGSRLAGFIILIFSIFTFSFFIGFVTIVLAFYLILKRNEYVLNIQEGNLKKTITFKNDKVLAFKVLSNLNKAVFDILKSKSS